MSRGRKGSESSRNSKRNWHFSSHSFGFGTATFYLRLHWTLSSPQAPVVLIGGDVVFTSQTIDHVQQGPCSLQLEHDPWEDTATAFGFQNGSYFRLTSCHLSPTLTPEDCPDHPFTPRDYQSPRTALGASYEISPADYSFQGATRQPHHRRCIFSTWST